MALPRCDVALMTREIATCEGAPAQEKQCPCDLGRHSNERAGGSLSGSSMLAHSNSSQTLRVLWRAQNTVVLATGSRAGMASGDGDERSQRDGRGRQGWIRGRCATHLERQRGRGRGRGGGGGETETERVNSSTSAGVRRRRRLGGRGGPMTGGGYLDPRPG